MSNTSTTAAVAEPAVWFTWRRMKWIAGFILLFILAVNFLEWWRQTIDEHHPVKSQRELISSATSTVYQVVEPYLVTPVDVVLAILWFLGIVLPILAIFVAAGGTLWAIFSPSASRK